jgi:hypothetical protein
MCLAAGGALVAVSQSTKVKTSLCMEWDTFDVDSISLAGNLKWIVELMIWQYDLIHSKFIKFMNVFNISIKLFS